MAKWPFMMSFWTYLAKISSSDSTKLSELEKNAAKQQTLRATSCSWAVEDILHDIISTNRSSDESFSRMMESLSGNLQTSDTLDISYFLGGKRYENNPNYQRYAKSVWFCGKK